VKAFYQQIANWVNQSLGRKAIRAKQIEEAVQKAKRIRRQQGVWGLWNYASQLPYQYFTEAEMEHLRQLPEWPHYAQQFIHHLIQEGVVTPWEAKMMERYI